METMNDVIDHMLSVQRTRFLGFGSSNTERRVPGMHWLDCLELGILYKYGSIQHMCINSGRGGHSTFDLLARFDDDVKLFKPHVVFITVGGNDSNPAKNMDAETYRANLLEIISRTKGIGAFPILQTYYAVQEEDLSTEHLDKFYHFMDIVRELAKSTDSYLIDHLKRWMLLRKNHLDIYNSLMQNAFHVNHKGNMLMGVDIQRHFNILPEIFPYKEVWEEAWEYQKIMDAEEAKK